MYPFSFCQHFFSAFITDVQQIFQIMHFNQGREVYLGMEQDKLTLTTSQERDRKMIYIYNCYGGTHTSALAAAYHLNRLPRDRKPLKEEILNSYLFDKLTSNDHGKLIHHGKDDQGNDVFSVGRGSSKAVIPGIYGSFQLMENRGELSETVVISNTSPTVPWLMTVGGFCSRALKLTTLGRMFLVLGAQKTYKNIINLVDASIQSGHTAPAKVLLLNNTEFKP